MTTSTSWWTGIDRKKYSKQAREIWDRLHLHGGWVPVEMLEFDTGAKRVASRIDELRDDWCIETSRNPETSRAMYQLIGRHPEGYKRPRKIRPTDVETEVMQERRRQVAMGWTAEHDDGHAEGMDWLTMNWLRKAQESPEWEPDSKYREHMVQVAALAIADVERYDRKYK